jgi:hypothetical protein
MEPWTNAAGTLNVVTRFRFPNLPQVLSEIVTDMIVE